MSDLTERARRVAEMATGETAAVIDELRRENDRLRLIVSRDPETADEVLRLREDLRIATAGFESCEQAMKGWQAIAAEQAEKHKEARRVVVRLEREIVGARDEVDRLTAERGRLTQEYLTTSQCLAAANDDIRRLAAERDAIARLCFRQSADDRDNSFYRIDVDPADGLTFEDLGLDGCDFDTEVETVAALRIMARIDPPREPAP